MRFTWQTVASGQGGPGPRSRHCLVHDRAARVTVLFAGIIWTGDGVFPADTWELRDRNWLQVDTFSSPPPRHRGAMVFDSRRGCSVLFGGQGADHAFLNDTWTYASRGWSRRKWWWKPSPSPRCGHSMAFDEERGETVLFGGIDPRDNPLGDTWVFNGSWRQVMAPGPPPRRYAAFAYTPGLKGCLLHGGSVDDAGQKGYGNAWLFREGTWTRLPEGFATDVRDDHGLGFHHKAGTLVMLEGVGGARGLLTLSADGWQPAEVSPLHPRHQCSPLVWDDALDGLVRHGGEAHHRGPQFDATCVLRLQT